MAGYVIHVAPGLSARAYRRAVELGPAEMGSRRDSPDLLRTARFSNVEQVEVTETLRSTCSALLDSRERHAVALRVAEGEDEFEDEQRKKRGLLEGISAGFCVARFWWERSYPRGAELPV